MKLNRALLSSTWAIREQSAVSFMPLVERYFNGDHHALQTLKSSEVSSVVDAAEKNSVSVSNKVVAIIPVKDVIMKEDFCGELGTKSMDNLLKSYYADDEISAIILHFDTPGGQSSYLDNFAQTIQKRNKPVVSYVEGQCCSGGYYMASNCDGIFASVQSDEIGSIGTMLQFSAPNPKHKDNERYIVHSIYAKKSTEKNLPFREALEGKYDLIRQTVLDPINEIFHSYVRAGRKNIDEKVFAGAVFLAKDAEKLGLIDGLKSFDEVVQYAIELSEMPKDMWNKLKQDVRNFLNPNNNMSVKLERVSELLGKEVTNENGLTAAELEELETKLTEEEGAEGAESEGAESEGAESETEEEGTEGAESEEEEEEGSEGEGAENQASALAAIVAGAVSAAIAPLNERIAQLEGRTTTQPTTPKAGAAQQSSSKDQPWADPENEFNKSIQAELKARGLA